MLANMVYSSESTGDSSLGQRASIEDAEKQLDWRAVVRGAGVF